MDHWASKKKKPKVLRDLINKKLDDSRNQIQAYSSKYSEILERKEERDCKTTSLSSFNARLREKLHEDVDKSQQELTSTFVSGEILKSLGKLYFKETQLTQKAAAKFAQ